MIEFLQGKKIYILAACGALATFAYFLNWIDYQVYEILLGLFGFGTLAALRAGVSK